MSEKVQKWFSEHYPSSNGHFYLTYRTEPNYPRTNNSFGIVFFDNWYKIIQFIQEHHLDETQIIYYGLVNDNLNTVFQSNGEAYQIKAIDDLPCEGKWVPYVWPK